MMLRTLGFPAKMFIPDRPSGPNFSDSPENRDSGISSSAFVSVSVDTISGSEVKKILSKITLKNFLFFKVVQAGRETFGFSFIYAAAISLY